MCLPSRSELDVVVAEVSWAGGSPRALARVNIAKPYVSENTYDGYEVDVRVHLVPGPDAHKLDKLEPEHLERFYRKMQDSGSAPGTAHHAHHTIRVVLGEANRRGHVVTNVAEIAKAPRLEEEDIEPFTVEEVQSLLVEAAKLRNSARRVVALALGLRQGEALGLHWEDVDLGAGYARIRKNRLRPKYADGRGDNPCGRKAGYCPQKQQTRRERKSTKSRCRTSHDRLARPADQAASPAPGGAGEGTDRRRYRLAGQGKGIRLRLPDRRVPQPEHRLPHLEAAPEGRGRTRRPSPRGSPHRRDRPPDPRRPGRRGRRDHGLGARGSGPHARPLHARHRNAPAEGRPASRRRSLGAAEDQLKPN